MAALVMPLIALASCDGDADHLLRDENKVPVAWVIPTGGTISSDAKTAANGEIGLMSTVISDQQQVLNYLSGSPTILEFKGVTEIACEFNDPVFDNVNKLIFDGSIQQVGSNAFLSLNSDRVHRNGETFSNRVLTQVIFKGTDSANIGDLAFGEYDNPNLLIVVPNNKYIDESYIVSTERTGNYRYWQSNNIRNKEGLNVLWIVPNGSVALPADPDDLEGLIKDGANDDYKYVRAYYFPKINANSTTSCSEIVIERPYRQTGGRPAEMAFYYARTTYTDDSGVSHGIGEPVEGTSLNYGAGFTSTTDAAGRTVIDTMQKAIIPAEITRLTPNDGEGRVDIRAVVTKWLPDGSYSKINVLNNWPAAAVNSADQTDGEILVEIGTVRSYFEKSPGIPRDATGRQIAFWDSVTYKKNDEKTMVFDGKTGDHWDLKAEVEGTTDIASSDGNYRYRVYTNSNGEWMVDEAELSLWAHWINAATNVGVDYWVQKTDIDQNSTWDDTSDYTGWMDYYANQRADDLSILTPTSIEDIAVDPTFRPGYTFKNWAFKNGYDAESTGKKTVEKGDEFVISEYMSDGGVAGDTLTTFTEVYAVWEPKKYTVNFYGAEDVNSISPMTIGDGTGIVEDVSGTEIGQTKVVLTGVDYNTNFSTISFTPARAGYRFEGWFTTSTVIDDADVTTGYLMDDNSRINMTDCVVLQNWSLDSDGGTVNLYAHWTPVKTTVTVKNVYPKDHTDANPADVAEDIVIEYVYEGASPVTTATILYPSGYSYMLSGAYLGKSSLENAYSDGTHSVYDTSEGLDTDYFEFQVLDQLLRPYSTPTGVTGINDGTTSYTTVRSTDGTAVWTYLGNGLEDGTLTLYAQYIPANSFDVTFHFNWMKEDWIGTEDPTKVFNIQYGEYLPKPATEQGASLSDGDLRLAEDFKDWDLGDGYHFFGWFTTSTTFSDYASTAQDAFGKTPADYAFDWDDANDRSVETITKSLDLYAHWMPKRYRITLDPNAETVQAQTPDFRVRRYNYSSDAVMTSFTTVYGNDVVFESVDELDWYGTSQASGGMRLEGFSAVESSSRAMFPVSGTDADYNAIIANVSQTDFDSKVEIDWTVAGSRAVTSSDWTDSSKVDGLVDLYAIWHSTSQNGSRIADKQVSLLLSTGNDVAKIGSLEIKTLNLWVYEDPSNGRGYIKSRSQSAANNVTYSKLSETPKTFNGLNATIKGFYDRPQGEAGMKILEADGSPVYTKGGVSLPVYGFNISTGESENLRITNSSYWNDNNGYWEVLYDGKVVWIGGGCTLYAWWN